LKQSGVTDVFVVGGPSAVAPNVVQQLQQTPSYTCGGGLVRQGPEGSPLNLKVTQIGGATRYETDQMIAEYPGAGPTGGTETFTQSGTFDPTKPGGTSVAAPAQTAILASGANFPDALAAGPLAFNGSDFDGGSLAPGGLASGGFGTDGAGYPLILTDPNSLSSTAANALQNLAIKNVLVMGGSAAVSAAVVTAVQALNGGIKTLQFAGANRNDTASQFATYISWSYGDPPASGTTACAAGAAVNPTCTKIAGLGMNSFEDNGIAGGTTFLARGDDFADALSAGPSAGGGENVLVLTANSSTLSAETTAFLTSHDVNHLPVNGSQGSGIATMVVMGGTVAIQPAVVTAGIAALGA
jgi:hypothetical protein